MGEFELRKLKRSELLEIMLAQSEEIDRLKRELAYKNKQLEERRIVAYKAGSIAEASLQLTHVFQEAQKAADLYVENVKRRADEIAAQAASPRSAHSAPQGSGAFQQASRQVQYAAASQAAAPQYPAASAPRRPEAAGVAGRPAGATAQNRPAQPARTADAVRGRHSAPKHTGGRR